MLSTKMYGFAESSDSIAAQLSSPETEQDVFQTRAVLRKALESTTSHQGSGERSLLPHVVKLLASSDIVVKKLATWYIVRYAGQEDLVLLAVNTLVKDCADPNPMVRGLALRTLSSFPTTDLAQYAVSPVVKALSDSSAYVRRVAVVGCAKLFNLQSDLLTGQGVVDTLYSMIRDTDPLVVVNCLCSLEEMLQAEGGVVVNRNIARFLLNQLDRFTDWGLVTVFRTLNKYLPGDEDEILAIMNIADKYLKYHNSSVVLTCMQYFLLIVKDLPHLKGEIFRRAKPQLIQSMGSGNAELCHVLLEFIDSILDEHSDIFLENYASFFCKYSEPLAVKIKKLDILPRLVTAENISEVLEELGLYCSDLNVTLSKHAIMAMGQIASKHPRHHDVCLQRLVDLLRMDIDYVTSNVLQVLKCLELQGDEQLSVILNLLPQCLTTVTCSEGRSAIWCLFGEYGETFDETPYILEAAIKDVTEETNIDVRLHLLNASMKMFFRRPAEMQDALGQLLEVLCKCGSHDIEDRARWYYNLLQTDVRLAEMIVLGS